METFVQWALALMCLLGLVGAYISLNSGMFVPALASAALVLLSGGLWVAQ